MCMSMCMSMSMIYGICSHLEQPQICMHSGQTPLPLLGISSTTHHPSAILGKDFTIWRFPEILLPLNLKYQRIFHEIK